jgi:hypothetical protein
MGLLANDPWFMSHYILGWQLMGTLGIFLLALILQGILSLAGARRKLRLISLLVSLVTFVFAVTIMHVVNAGNMRISWDDIVISFLPALTAPIVAFLGSLVWPRKRTGVRNPEG